ncbi:hypothetical protein RFI_02732, partial [Reticulomyxa filosa]
SEKYYFAFTEIGKLVTKAKGAFVDVIGYVDEMTELRTIFSTTFRTILLVDPSGKVEISLWGETAQQFDEKVKESHCIAALKGCRVTSHGGHFSICTKPKGLSLSSGNIMQINPKSLPEFASLQAWGRECNFDFAFIPHVTWKAIQSGFGFSRRTIAQFIFWNDCLSRTQQNEMIQQLDKPSMGTFVVKATITSIPHNPNKPPWYKCSPFDYRKVISDGRGMWLCPFQLKTYSTYNVRYLLSLRLTDDSGSEWFYCLNSVADQILGARASDLEQFLKDGNIDEYNRVFQNATYKTKYFEVHISIGIRSQLRYLIDGVREIDPQKECADVLGSIYHITNFQTNSK